MKSNRESHRETDVKAEIPQRLAESLAYVILKAPRASDTAGGEVKGATRSTKNRI
jgi:hypothetical protein